MTPLSDTEADMSIPLPHDTDTWGKTPEPVVEVDTELRAFVWWAIVGVWAGVAVLAWCMA